MSGKAWVAQSVKRPTLDFGSGHNLTVHEFEPRTGLCADSGEPVWDAVSPGLSAPPPPPLMLMLSLSLPLSKINKLKGRLGGAVG